MKTRTPGKDHCVFLTVRICRSFSEDTVSMSHVPSVTIQIHTVRSEKGSPV